MPQDDLLPQAKATLTALGATSGTVSEIVKTKDAVVYKTIEEGIERANKHAVSHAQRVSLKTPITIHLASSPGFPAFSAEKAGKPGGRAIIH